MKTLLKNNGLSIALMLCFMLLELGLSVVGLAHENQQLLDHGGLPIDYWSYLRSASFLEATMENWESEFLQMFAYVIFTVVLYQKGSSESKPPGEKSAVDADPRLAPVTSSTPGPVKQGGWKLRIYENSLSLALLLLFFSSFALHAISGATLYNEEQLQHGGAPVSTVEYLRTAQFWFESLQNWQSEFLSIGVMVVLTIFLRQRGSPESKPVAAPHHETSS